MGIVNVSQVKLECDTSIWQPHLEETEYQEQAAISQIMKLHIGCAGHASQLHKRIPQCLQKALHGQHEDQLQ